MKQFSASAGSFKSRHALALLAGVCVMAASVSPAQAADERPESATSIPLDGSWDFSTDSALPIEQWANLAVPGNWDTTNEYAHYRGVAYYQRSFAAPPSWKQRHIRLHFEAVAGISEVWLNGQHLGKHNGGFTPFEFDVTGLIRWGTPNELRVSSDNSVAIGAFWPWGGISRRVSLLGSRDLRIEYQHAWAEPDLANGTAEVTGTIRLTNDGNRPLNSIVETRVEGTAALVQQRVTLAAHSSRSVPFALHLPTQDVRLWDFDHPNLYRLSTRVSSQAGNADVSETRFGIRKVQVTPEGLYLNGERVRLNGFNRVSDHPAFGNTEPLHLLKQDVDLMKHFGANLMRIMHMPQAPDLLDYLDQRGMLIFEEVPVWGAKDPNIKPNNPLVEQWLRETIERDYNHPCIIGWSVGNEMNGQGPYVRSIIPYIRQNLDGHRLLAYVSNTAAWPQSTPAVEPEDAADLVLFNHYGAMAGSAQTIRKRWPDKPIFFSEYGTRQFGDQLSAKIPMLEKNWNGVAQLPYVIGASLWTFNDYRSNFRGSSPAELRSWGVVDQWRQPKTAAQQIARINAPVHSLKVNGSVIDLIPRGPQEIPSFSLHDYFLEWEWRHSNGEVIGGSVVRLAPIVPGNAGLQKNAGIPPATEDCELVANLISPTGYVVAQSDWWQPGRPTVTKPPTKAQAEGEASLPAKPLIRCVYPVDGGFFIAHDTQKEDTSVIAEWGIAGDLHPNRLTLLLPGALFVSGLKNGQRYVVRICRLTAAGQSPWSEPATVTPDGALPPPAPSIGSIVRGRGGLAVIHFEVIDKTIGYRLKYADKTIDIPTAAAGVAVVQGLDDTRLYTFTLTALNAYGESTPSPASTCRPIANDRS